MGIVYRWGTLRWEGEFTVVSQKGDGDWINSPRSVKTSPIRCNSSRGINENSIVQLPMFRSSIKKCRIKLGEKISDHLFSLQTSICILRWSNYPTSSFPIFFSSFSPFSREECGWCSFYSYFVSLFSKMRLDNYYFLGLIAVNIVEAVTHDVTNLV